VRLVGINAELAEVWTALEERSDAALAPTRSTPSP
jgi:hypothetical protein